MRSDVIKQIVAAVTSFGIQQFNLYRNESVTNTRSLHIDNIGDTYKVFLYLSDVEAAGEGPYMYVPMSQKDKAMLSKIIYLNKVKGVRATDMPAFPAVQFLGKAGTAIISCQGGIHGGLPQRPGASRTVLVSNYYS